MLNTDPPSVESSAAAALFSLLSRYSLGIKHLTEPGPSDADLQTLLAASLRAPDHGGLIPFRFVVVRGDSRERLALLFAAHAEAQGKDKTSIDIEKQRALQAPVSLAVVARIDAGHPLVPAHEQWMCIGGAICNLLSAAHMLGFAGKMLSGNKARSATISEAFCQPGEILAGWIALGTAQRPLKPKLHKEKQQVLRYW